MKNKVIFLTTDSMGSGERELGTQLLETFATLLKQREQLPAAVFCVNRGVLALTEQSFASLHLKELEGRGVPVLACGTCVNYYGIQDQLAAGEVSSMGRFLELAEQYEVITIA
ncbi:DsrE family protein [Paenibacillus sp. TH7-28]